MNIHKKTDLQMAYIINNNKTILLLDDAEPMTCFRTILMKKKGSVCPLIEVIIYKRVMLRLLRNIYIHFVFLSLRSNNKATFGEYYNIDVARHGKYMFIFVTIFLLLQLLKKIMYLFKTYLVQFKISM